MFRLILLTIVGLFGVLAFYGTPEMAGGSPVDREATLLAVAAPARPATPAPAPAPRSIPADVLIRAALSGPAPQESPPGPRLRPSPDAATRQTALPAAAAEADAPLYATGDNLNLRETPDAAGRVILALSRGDMVRPVAPAVGAWVEVEVGEVGSAERGFVSARYLSRNRPG